MNLLKNAIKLIKINYDVFHISTYLFFQEYLKCKKQTKNDN